MTSSNLTWHLRDLPPCSSYLVISRNDLDFEISGRTYLVLQHNHTHTLTHTHTHTHTHTIRCRHHQRHSGVWTSGLAVNGFSHPELCGWSWRVVSGVYDVVNFFLEDDDTSKHDDTCKDTPQCSIWATATTMDLQRLLTSPGYSWRRKCMRETRVEWTEFTWLSITYLWVIFYLHTRPPPLTHLK